MTTFIKTAPTRELHVPTDARAILVIIHGMAEYSGRYRPAIEFFNAHGIGCCTFDQRGHGHAVASERDRGDVTSFDDFVTDAAGVIEGVRAQYQDLPVFVWGHSMGAIVATLTAARLAASGPGKIRGVITSSAPIASFDSYPSLVLRLFELASKIIPRVRVQRPFHTERLSRNPEVGARYAADPLVPRALTLRFLVGLYEASAQCLRAARKLRMPWLALHGSNDQMAPPIGSQRLIDALVSTDKQLRLWPDARHEVHNEIEPTRTEVLTCIVDWVLQRV
jgi:alpha-beta hydrolase superfamily lysophospholipase